MEARPRSGVGRLVVALVVVPIVAVIGSCLSLRSDYGPPSASYRLALSADGQRMLVAKWTQDAGNTLWEGAVGAPLQPVQPPPGERFAGTAAYAAQGPSLLYASVQAAAGDVNGRTRLWKLDPGGKPELVLEHPSGIGQVLPLRDGRLVLWTLAAQIARGDTFNPNPRATSNWRVYGWKLWKPDGEMLPLRIPESPFGSPTSLVRDAALVRVEDVRNLADRAAQPRHVLVTVPLGQEKVPEMPADLVPATGLTEPRLACDWSGATCLRVTTHEKKVPGDAYYAHRGEVVRHGRSCGVLPAQDRIEHAALASGGDAVLMLTRPSPRVQEHVAAYFELAPGGCAITRQLQPALP